MVALKYKHGACAALLNPSSAEPLVWPSPLKFISELNPEAKALLERALIEANKEREKAILKETVYSIPSPLHSDVGIDDNASEVSFLSVIYALYFSFIIVQPDFRFIFIFNFQFGGVFDWFNNRNMKFIFRPIRFYGNHFWKNFVLRVFLICRKISF